MSSEYLVLSVSVSCPDDYGLSWGIIAYHNYICCCLHWFLFLKTCSLAINVIEPVLDHDSKVDEDDEGKTTISSEEELKLWVRAGHPSSFTAND